MPPQLILAAVTTGISVFSSISKSRSEASAITSQSEFEARQFEINSRLAKVQAKSAKERGKRESEEELRKTKLLIGRQRANLAAQGIDIGFGSALDVQLETAELGAQDALTIRNNAFRESLGFKIEALDFKSRAALTIASGRSRSRQTLVTGGLNAAKSLISGGFSAASGGFGGGTTAGTTSFGAQGPFQVAQSSARV